MRDEDLRFERVVASLEAARHDAENEHKKAQKLRAELDEAKRKSDMRERELEIKLEKAMNEAREKANQFLENARYKSSLLLNELEEMKKQMNAENAARLAEKARLS